MLLKMPQLTTLTIVLISCLLTQTQNLFRIFHMPSAFQSKIYAGEIHYSRVPVEYWPHRIQMIKALGLNAMGVYVMWNHHEIEKGVFDFQSENRNLSKFLQMASDNNMSVIFRPGPYVCAQWDFGGLPARLLAIDGLAVRANNPQFLSETRLYFQALAPIIKKYLKNKQNPNGPIILLQIQNEYGSYGTDLNYINALRAIWAQLGVEAETYHEDGPSLIKNSHWAGANIGLSGGWEQTDFQYARAIQKKGALFGGEIYTGWLTHWGESWASTSTTKNVQMFSTLISNNHSFSMYMSHGGTNFGLSAGANSISGKTSDYWAHVTSYDYDSPINEQGQPTAKYYALRDLIKPNADWSVPEVPSPIPTITISKFVLERISSLVKNAGDAIFSQKPQIFQSEELKMFNQGIVVYWFNISKGIHHLSGIVHDYGILIYKNQKIAAFDRHINPKFYHSFTCAQSLCELGLIVQAMGHVNYGTEMGNDHKGLLNFNSSLQSVTFKMSKVPIEYSDFEIWEKTDKKFNGTPYFYKTTLNLNQIGDTYFDMSEWVKGYLFVNGRNLGRYWNKGPQKRLFCPGVWLNKGNNIVAVLELEDNLQEKGISTYKTLIPSSQIF